MRVLILSLVCAVVLLASVDARTYWIRRISCPFRWTRIKGRCYRYVSRALPWAQAEKNCLRMNGHLASVHSSSQYHDIQVMIAKITHRFGRTWLGGSDCQKEGIWLWSDGTPFNYRHCGRFDNLWRSQHCLQMNYGANKCWDDVQCYRRLPSVCVRNAYRFIG